VDVEDAGLLTAPTNTHMHSQAAQSSEYDQRISWRVGQPIGQPTWAQLSCAPHQTHARVGG
jgi:hypothetical protein